MSSFPARLIGLPHLPWVAGNAVLHRAIAATHEPAIRAGLPDAETLLTWLRQPSLLDGALNAPHTGVVESGQRRGARLVEQPALVAGGDGRWSVACVERFGRIQALAITDHVASVVLLSRAPLGEIPVCYLDVDSRLVVAFTAEHLARSFPDRVHVDQGRIADALVDFLQWIDLRSTFYREIRKLPSGCWASFDGTTTREGRWWRPPSPSATAGLHSDADYERAMLEALERAVMVRCSAGEGNLGSMLSGGLDSSSVVAIAGRMRARAGGVLPVLSLVRSGDPDCVESRAVGDAAASPGVESHLLDLSRPGANLAELERSLWEVDEPWDVHGSLFRWVYLEAQRLGLDVVLDGVDGDSLFLEGDLIVRQLRRLAWVRAWRNVDGGERFWGTGVPAWRSFVAECRMAFGLGIGRLVRRPVSALRGTDPPDRLETLLRDYPIDPTFARKVDLAARAARYDAERGDPQAFDVRGPELGVERYFRAAAPYGVLPAHPFMDPDLVAFCLALPREQCLVDGWPKSVLRRAMRGLLPDSVRWRRGKQHLGFELTRTVVASNPVTLDQRLRRLRPSLDGIVRQAVLDHHCTSPPCSEADLLQRIELLGLAEWLQRRAHLF